MLLPDMPAEDKLKPGDRIFKMDGKNLTSSKSLWSMLAKKKDGDICNTYI